eukprot:5641347-Alexandrium_andersonii.AAC.1
MGRGGAPETNIAHASRACRASGQLFPLSAMPPKWWAGSCAAAALASARLMAAHARQPAS